MQGDPVTTSLCFCVKQQSLLLFFIYFQGSINLFTSKPPLCLRKEIVTLLLLLHLFNVNSYCHISIVALLFICDTMFSSLCDYVFSSMHKTQTIQAKMKRRQFHVIPIVL